MKRVLIVEDDKLAAELERDYLEADGFKVDLCDDGKLGLAQSLEGGYDLLILDIMLPGVNGFEICRQVRSVQDIPIVLVTARRDDIDKVYGFNLGADDYVVKPFSPAELVARVQAHIRMHDRLKEDSAAEGDEMVFGDLVIACSQRRVVVRGEEVELANREFELLVFLASHPGMVYSRDSLFEHVWGMSSNGDSATVTVHVNRIRDKIEKDSSIPEYIQTVRGAGYRFNSAWRRKRR